MGSAIDNLEEVLAGRWIEVPKGLLEEVHGEGWRLERTEAALLLWLAVAQRTYGNKYRTITNKTFKRIIPSNSTRAAARKWLIERGWLDVEKWTAHDGTVRDKVLPGKISKSYRAKGTELEKEGVELQRLSSLKIYPDGTDEDPLCKNTKDVLSNLELQKERIRNNSDIISNNSGPLLHSIIKLSNGLGSVRRGRRVRRIYSPWTGCKREGRKLFKLYGEDLTSFDLRAAQPTLIGTLAGSLQFLRDSSSGKLYRDIAEVLEVERDAAKEACYAYAFGPNRKQTTKNRRALAVQELIQKNYPEVHQYVWKQKLTDYRKFACMLQDKEAELFLDKILKELIQRNIPALTVHDSVYVMSSNSEEGLRVIEKHLDGAIPDGCYEIEQQK